MKKVKIKICGLTRAEDVEFLKELNVDFAGFIFVTGSPRYLDRDMAENIIFRVPDRILRVGVFADEKPNQVKRIIRRYPLDILQFHGNESPRYCRQFGLPYFKSIRVKDTTDSRRLVEQLYDFLDNVEEAFRLPRCPTPVPPRSRPGPGGTPLRRGPYREWDSPPAGFLPGVGLPSGGVPTGKGRRYNRHDTPLEPDAFLLDTFSKKALGGTGETFDWQLAREAEKLGIPIILAGGLNPENVADAIRKVRPWGVDVSSGVESSPGVKDHKKMRKFVKSVRKTERGSNP